MLQWISATQVKHLLSPGKEETFGPKVKKTYFLTRTFGASNKNIDWIVAFLKLLNHFNLQKGYFNELMNYSFGIN